MKPFIIKMIKKIKTVWGERVNHSHKERKKITRMRMNISKIKGYEEYPVLKEINEKLSGLCDFYLLNSMKEQKERLSEKGIKRLEEIKHIQPKRMIYNINQLIEKQLSSRFLENYYRNNLQSIKTQLNHQEE